MFLKISLILKTNGLLVEEDLWKEKEKREQCPSQQVNIWMDTTIS